MEDSKIYDKEIRRILLEKSLSFEIDGTTYYIYQPSLGQNLLISEAMEDMIVEHDGKVTIQDLFFASKTNKKQLCKVLAYYTLKSREELLNNEIVKERTELFFKKLDIKKVAGYMLILFNEIPLEKLYRHIGLEADRRDLAKINRYKESTNNNSFSFGGRSLFGSLIVPACEKLNMNPQQVIWDISYRMLQMLMADSVTSVYLTDDEAKKCRVTNDRTYINMDNKDSKDIIKSMDWS